MDLVERVLVATTSSRSESSVVEIAREQDADWNRLDRSDKSLAQTLMEIRTNPSCMFRAKALNPEDVYIPKRVRDRFATHYGALRSDLNRLEGLASRMALDEALLMEQEGMLTRVSTPTGDVMRFVDDKHVTPEKAGWAVIYANNKKVYQVRQSRLVNTNMLKDMAQEAREHLTHQMLTFLVDHGAMSESKRQVIAEFFLGSSLRGLVRLRRSDPTRYRSVVQILERR
jgi:Fe-S cluster biosynthesis and repair protein YggX